MIPNNPAPGSYVEERDLSFGGTVPPGGKYGAIVVDSVKGDPRWRYIMSPQEYVNRYGAPDPRRHPAAYTAFRFLMRGFGLLVGRATKNALHGGCIFSKVPNEDPNVPRVSAFKPMIIGEKDPLNTLVMSDDMVLAIVSAGPGADQLSASIERNTRSSDGGLILKIYEGESTTATETHYCSLEYKQDGYGNQMFIEQVVNTKSQLVKVKVNLGYEGGISDSLIDDGPIRLPGKTVGIHMSAFGGGRDSVPLSMSNDEDLGIISEKLDELRDIERWPFNVLIGGGWTHPVLTTKMDEVMQYRKYSTLVSDLPVEAQVDLEVMRAWRTGAGQNTQGNISSIAIDSSHTAFYTSDILVQDSLNGVQLYVPSSGDVAASYLETDKKWGIHYSPAGYKRGHIKALGVRRVYSKEERQVLQDLQINPLRVYTDGAGIKIWGDNTAQVRQSLLSFVPVRRLMNFLEETMERETDTDVFDPNNYMLRKGIKSRLENILRPVKSAGGLFDFRVVCDDRIFCICRFF